MSTAEHPYAVKVEPERLPGPRLTVILVVGIAIIIASAILVKKWLPSRLIVESAVQGEHERIGNLEQTLFVSTWSAQRKEELKKRTLTEYAWVDRDRGVVAIPIAQAMKLVVEQQR
jgi:hypothetical protein